MRTKSLPSGDSVRSTFASTVREWHLVVQRENRRPRPMDLRGSTTLTGETPSERLVEISSERPTWRNSRRQHYRRSCLTKHSSAFSCMADQPSQPSCVRRFKSVFDSELKRLTFKTVILQTFTGTWIGRPVKSLALTSINCLFC